MTHGLHLNLDDAWRGQSPDLPLLDAREWGPVGPRAVAIARDMVCSPCYLSKVEDCHRGLACLRELEPGRVYEACKRLLLLAAIMSWVTPRAAIVFPNVFGVNWCLRFGRAQFCSAMKPWPSKPRLQ